MRETIEGRKEGAVKEKEVNSLLETLNSEGMAKLKAEAETAKKNILVEEQNFKTTLQ